MTSREIIHRLAHVADPLGDLAAHLAGTSFCQDPASTRFHRCYAGGLADHCLGVFLYLRRLSFCGFQAADAAPLARIALCHDLCKVGRYQQTVKSEKRKTQDGQRYATDYNGKVIWDPVPGFEYAPAKDLVLGHGDTSLFLAMRILGDLVPAEAMAIRFHMGAYDAAPGEGLTRLSDAMALSPLVILTQAAELMDTYQGEDAKTLARTAEVELMDAGILPDLEV